jgi:uncharacterized protein (DUF362 family)
MIEKINEYNLAKILNLRLWEELPPVNNKKVFIKPNLVTPPHKNDKHSTTHPIILEALLIKLKENSPASITVGCCGFKDQWEYTIKLNGYGELCAKYDVQLVCLQQGENFHKYTLKRFENKNEYLSLYGTKISDFFLDANVRINLPKMKIHTMASMTGAIKNTMGVISPKGSMHPGGSIEILHKRLCDLYGLMREYVDWTLMDGIIGSEFAEQFGVAKQAGWLISNKDMWMVDCVASGIMGFLPGEVLYLKYIHQKYFSGQPFPEVLKDMVIPFEKSIKDRT